MTKKTDINLSQEAVQAMDRRIDQLREGQVCEARLPNAIDSRAGIDPKDIAEHTQDAVRGEDRDPAKWTQVMQAHGFRWYEPKQLDAYVGQVPFPTGQRAEDGREIYAHKPHQEGQWRHNGRKMAFTIRDLVVQFRAPQAFAQWLERADLQARAHKHGLVLPKGVS